jgi:hypothetical protein
MLTNSPSIADNIIQHFLVIVAPEEFVKSIGLAGNGFWVNWNL